MFFGYIDPGSGYTLLGSVAWFITFFAGIFGLLVLFSKKIIKKVIQYKKIVLLFILVITSGGGLFLVMKNFRQLKNPLEKRIIILEIDALCPDKVEELIKNGRMPNTARLVNTYPLKKLSTSNPAQSPVVWTCIASGRNPGQHGLFDFIKRDPLRYTLDLATTDIKDGKPKNPVAAKRFWDYSSGKNIPSAVISFPVTFPAGDIHGKMLSGMGVPDVLGTEGTFSFYTSEQLEDTGNIKGNVLFVEKIKIINTHITGPRIKTSGRKTQELLVPMNITILENDKVSLEFQENRFDLTTGSWSDWKHITFRINMFKKMRGILKFYLVSASPHLKLYASPINFDPSSPYFKISHPAEYSRELSNSIGLFHTLGSPIETKSVSGNIMTQENLLETAEEVYQERKKMLELELNRMDSGIISCYFGVLDIIQHMFWYHTDPKNPLYNAENAEKYSEIITQWYVRFDSLIGEVMSDIDPGKDILIIISDHGFGPFRRMVHINNWLEASGYLNLRPGTGYERSELFTNIDWSRTLAYAAGFSGIYINLEGREASGTVKPGKLQQIKKEIADKLMLWQDDKCQDKIVNRVYMQEEIFKGEKALQAPDLVIGFKPGWRASWQTALGGMGTCLIEDNTKKWSGSHLFDPELVPGIIISNRRITRDRVSVYDILPTILRLIGYSEEELEALELEGRPLFSD